MTLVYILSAFVLGAIVSTQPPINAQIAAIFGSPLLAATFSISVSAFLIVGTRLALDHASIDWSTASRLPWWAIFGGVVGAMFVVISLFLAPKIGVATFFVFVVLGQLLGAAIIDHIGAFGAAVTPISFWRATGIGLVILGAALTRIDSWL